MTRQFQPVPAADNATDKTMAILQRKCACGKPASPLREECPECQARLGLQTKLTIGASDDPLEHEADLTAAQVMGIEQAAVTNHRVAVPTLIRRGKNTPAGNQAAIPDSIHHTLRTPGERLPQSTRSFFEPRFGHDFGQVRVHRDATAARSASEVNAHAYTVGNHVVFGSGKFAPENPAGRELIAHELAHVVQQSSATGELLQRAITQQGALTIRIDYSSICTVAVTDRANRIVSLVTTLAGAAPAAAQNTAIRALAASEQYWLMFALKLLNDNITLAGSLDRAVAVQRLITQAPRSSHAPLPDMDNRFVREVLLVSGWSETAQAERLSAPSASDRTAIDTVVNPPPSTGSVGDPLDVAALNSRLPPALSHFLNAIDPAGRTNVGTRSISAFQAIGDLIQEEARSFFAPYADAAIGNLFDLRPSWHASANIFDVGALTPSASLRESYLRNRAEIVGRNTSSATRFNDTNIFADVHFDPTRATDRAALASIVSTMAVNPAIQPIVVRLIQHTGRQSGSGSATRIGLVTDYDADQRTACEDHWRGIDTLCHEILHALVHPDFEATAARISFPQVVREGFTEVLGAQLFNDRVVPKANSTAAFKTSLETGVTGAPCPTPAAATIGYGSAGTGAESIRTRVGDNNFRAAYFLGRPELAGLPT